MVGTRKAGRRASMASHKYEMRGQEEREREREREREGSADGRRLAGLGGGRGRKWQCNCGRHVRPNEEHERSTA
jgi:hypothetical protein